MSNHPDELAAEAEAFDQRITERQTAGFIPDMRRLVKCSYFYKSFWRDPHFARLYLGRYMEILLGFLRRHGRPEMRLLDVGCGPGYLSLEFARAGHHVTAIDIAAKAIETARQTLVSSPYGAGSGSLEYHVRSLEEAEGTYDAVIFTGVIHHFNDPHAVVRKAATLLAPGGLVLCLEPQHEIWQESDAAVVALIRGLLAATGYWFEPELAADLKSESGWKEYAKEVHEEYATEKDRNERYQSPNDNASTGEQILGALRSHLTELECVPGCSFIYRLLGGLRGPDDVVHPLADMIAAFDRFAVANGHLRPNHYLWVGRKS